MEKVIEEKYDRLIDSSVEEAEKEGFRSMGLSSGLSGYSIWDKQERDEQGNVIHYMLTVRNEIVKDSNCHKE